MVNADTLEDDPPPLRFVTWTPVPPPQTVATLAGTWTADPLACAVGEGCPGCTDQWPSINWEEIPPDAES